MAAEPTLKTLLETGLGLLAMLGNGAWPDPPGPFPARLEALLDDFAARALALGKPPEAVDQASYAVCALADELLLASGSPLREAWSRAPLQLRRFGEHLAGEGFFRRLDQLRQDPVRHWEALEVYHACLLLGFRGRYLLEGAEHLPGLVERTGRDLVRARGEGPRLAPEALPAPLPPRPGAALPDLPPWGWAALLAGAALVLFLGFRLSLGQRAGRLAHPAGTPALARP